MKLCKHLEPILSYELNSGNSIKDINEDTWTNAVLVISFNNAINKPLQIKKYMEQIPFNVLKSRTITMKFKTVIFANYVNMQ